MLQFLKFEKLNQIALIFFILAKISGMVGFAMGFGSGSIRSAGGWMLGWAFILLLGSVVCCIVQMGKEKEKFEEEDKTISEMKRLKNYQYMLEMQIKELEEKRNILNSLGLK